MAAPNTRGQCDRLLPATVIPEEPISVENVNRSGANNNRKKCS
jgi:hypothetical protein